MTLEPDQIQLVRLMHPANADYVEAWQQLFQGAMIRARTASGKTCTVTLAAIEALLCAGVIAPSYGGAFHLTEQGKGLGV